MNYQGKTLTAQCIKGPPYSFFVKRGSENNDQFDFRNDKVVMSSNNAGGILGGSRKG